LQVVAVDRDPQQIPGARFIRADLEDGSPGPSPASASRGGRHQLPAPAAVAAPAESLAPGGVLIYETFMVGNERFGKPSNPRFSCGRELLEAFKDLTVKGYEEVELAEPKPAMIQRLCAVRAG